MAGNIRFHNKFHAYTHYTDPVPGLPGSAMDPIASKTAPFLGNMYVAGCLSARGWLDEDGVCRKFLFEAEPINCRPAQICGDHMEGALHYSHTTYSDLSTFDPLRLEIDFNVDQNTLLGLSVNDKTDGFDTNDSQQSNYLVVQKNKLVCFENYSNYSTCNILLVHTSKFQICYMQLASSQDFHPADY